MGIHVYQFLAGGKSRFRLVGPDKHAIRFKQVLDGGSFGQELGVRQNLKVQALVVAVQNSFHSGSSTNRQGGLFHDNLAFVGNFQNVAGGLFPVLQVRCLSGAMTKCLCGSVHRHEDNVRFLDSCGNVGAKEEIAATGTLYHIVQAGFKNREVFAIPGIDTSLVDIHHGHLHIGALVGDNGHGGATDVARTNTKNLGIETHSIHNVEKS